MAFAAQVFPILVSPAGAEERKVVALTAGEPLTFEQNGDTFRRAAKLGRNEVPLPAPVLQESAKGYVQVMSSHGLVWLDTMDVKISPQKSVASKDCIKLPGSSADTALAASRGAGEGCK